jgi:manganese-dependent inorganic pyrophosphatase
MATIYVTGHRNPDADSIAAAIGYAELKGRLDTRNRYVPVRLGEVNAQTRWLLERSRASQPQFLPHVMVRACDVMQTSFPIANLEAPIRQAGLEMARAGLELVPIVDTDGALAGVVTERALARRFIRETRETSTLQDAPTRVSAILEVLGGRLLTGEDKSLTGRVWVHSMDPGRSGASSGDVVVVGNRSDAQRLAIERGAQLLVLSNWPGSRSDSAWACATMRIPRSCSWPSYEASLPRSTRFRR